MMSLAKRAGSSYLSFGLLVYGYGAAGTEGPSAAPTSFEARLVSALGQAAGGVASAAWSFTHEPSMPSGGGGTGGAASVSSSEVHPPALASLGAR